MYLGFHGKVSYLFNYWTYCAVRYAAKDRPAGKQCRARRDSELRALSSNFAKVLLTRLIMVHKQCIGYPHLENGTCFGEDVQEALCGRKYMTRECSGKMGVYGSGALDTTEDMVGGERVSR